MPSKLRSGFKLAAPAKINFTLEVLGKRNDGFHEVRMLMAGISLYDELRFEPWHECVMECDLPDFDCGDGNLIMKAAHMLQRESGQALGARITLKKRIPIGAGLAGGSTDAAATLCGLNRLWKMGWSQRQLSKVAARLGSDIPFCLESGWALASGRGEKLKPLVQRKQFHLVLINPGFEVSTKWVYQNVDTSSGNRRNLSRRVCEALEENDFECVDRIAINDLEAVTAGAHPEIGMMRQGLDDLGALVTRMSGSGPTVWGLFKDETSAKKAEKALKNKHKFVMCVSTIGKIPAKL